jgi:hypothetical protein
LFGVEAFNALLERALLAGNTDGAACWRSGWLTPGLRGSSGKLRAGLVFNVIGNHDALTWGNIPARWRGRCYGVDLRYRASQGDINSLPGLRDALKPTTLVDEKRLDWPTKCGKRPAVQSYYHVDRPLLGAGKGKEVRLVFLNTDEWWCSVAERGLDSGRWYYLRLGRYLVAEDPAAAVALLPEPPLAWRQLTARCLVHPESNEAVFRLAFLQALELGRSLLLGGVDRLHQRRVTIRAVPEGVLTPDHPDLVIGSIARHGSILQLSRPTNERHFLIRVRAVGGCCSRTLRQRDPCGLIGIGDTSAVFTP